MSIIKILPDHLINRIAAGEVVERPSSVVKELVENSIDAGAREIVVEVKDGGKTLVRVSDSGCGMVREDAEKSILRHATSKIAEESDLWNIKTMGFRGEALASIASVSQMVLKTKTGAEVAGVEIVVDGGEVKTISDCGMKDGTVVEVNNLFFNTPARGNYLKKDSTELGHIISLLNTIALAHPEVAFKFISGGKLQMDLPGGVEGKRRIGDIFGKATADAMIPVFYGGSDFKLEGFIGKPVISRSDSRHQYIFVNGRPIQHHLIAYKVKEAFYSLLMEGKKPVFILNIGIDPSLIDVNVHPRKLEIRFEDESGILRNIYKAVDAALVGHNLAPKAYAEASRYMSDKFPDKDELKTFGAGLGESSLSQFGFERDQRSLDLSDAGKGFDVDAEQSLKAVTQVSNSYVVAQNAEGLVLVDQHAAHERIRYFELLDQYSTQNKNVQPLLMPEELELTLDEVGTLKENMEILEKLGFEIEEGPGGALVLYAVPATLSSEDISEVIHGVLSDIGHEKKPSNLQGRKEMILHYMACRSAIKFGQRLSIDEMDSLLKQLDEIDRPYTCPHGRPTMIKLTFDELERMFGRK